MREVGILFENYYLVGGYTFSSELEDEIKKQTFKYVGRIVPDDEVRKFNIEGRSLLELPSSSPSYNSVKSMLTNAGYRPSVKEK